MESKMDSMGHLETQVMQWLKWDRLVSIALSLSGQHKAPNPTDSNGLILDDLILQRLNGTQLVSISLILSGTFKAPPTWAKMDSFSMVPSGLHPWVIMSFVLIVVYMYLLVPTHLFPGAPFTDMG